MSNDVEWVLNRPILVLSAAMAVMIGSAALADDKPELIGTYHDWFAYKTGSGVNRQCYALSQPKQTAPAGLKRESPFFLISSWPGKKVKNEPSVVPGYA